MDKIPEWLTELKDHWNDGYWWADRQILLYAILFGIVAVYEVGTAYMKYMFSLKLQIGE